MTTEALMQGGLILLVLLFLGISYLRSRSKKQAEQDTTSAEQEGAATPSVLETNEEILEYFGIDKSKKGIRADFLPMKRILGSMMGSSQVLLPGAKQTEKQKKQKSEEN